MGLDFSRNAAEISDELNHGAVAQLGERGLCKPEVRGSIPLSSTMSSSPGAMNAAPAPGNSHPIHRLYHSPVPGSEQTDSECLFNSMSLFIQILG